MRTFYFSVRRDAVVYEDFTGEVLAGIPEAWDWAVRDAQKLVADDVLSGDPGAYWIEIVDDKRRPVATVPLARFAEN